MPRREPPHMSRLPTLNQSRPVHPAPDVSTAPSALATKYTEVEQHLTQRRQLLAQLDTQRSQLTVALLRLEGALGVLHELLAAETAEAAGAKDEGH